MSHFWAQPSMGGRCSQLSSPRRLPPVPAPFRGRDRISTGLNLNGTEQHARALHWATDCPFGNYGVQASLPPPQSQPGIGVISRPDAGKPWPFSPIGSEGCSPRSWIRLNEERNSKPSKSLHQTGSSLSPHSFCPREAEQTTASSALLPGLQSQTGAQTSRVPLPPPTGVL